MFTPKGFLQVTAKWKPAAVATCYKENHTSTDYAAIQLWRQAGWKWLLPGVSLSRSGCVLWLSCV